MPESKPPSRPCNPETLTSLGKQLRHVREAAGLAQGRVKNMRQGTVSKIENGLDVTLDTFITYAASLGFEIALLPIGQAVLPGPEAAGAQSASAPADLLTEFAHLEDPE
jgi:transcriptional regulator with XRE-family HTH domain